MKKVANSILVFAVILLPSNPVWPQNQEVKILEVSKEDMQGLLSRLSDLASKIQYIKLETNPDCLIGEVNYYRVLAFDKGFVIYHLLGKREILLFGVDGSFISKVGRLDKGPGEYNSSYKVAYDEFTEQLLVLNMKKVLIYDLKGKYQKTVSVDLADMIWSLAVVDAKSRMLTYMRPDNSGSYESGILWTDKQGKLINTFDLSDQQKLGSLPGFAHLNRIFQYGGDTYYSMYNHTRYYRFDNNNIWSKVLEIKTPLNEIPGSLINQIQTTTKSNIDLFDDFIRNNGMVRSTILKNGYLWVYFTNKSPQIILDYKNHNVFRWSSDPVYKASGIINDIDGGPPVYPVIFTGEDKIVGLLDASQLLAYHDQGLLTRHTATKTSSAELLNLVKRTKPDDNPIIRIVTLKN